MQVRERDAEGVAAEPRAVLNFHGSPHLLIRKPRNYKNHFENSVMRHNLFVWGRNIHNSDNTLQGD